jgi:Raf kinase inhibitor-like YbhB/YbcL family protein
MTSSVFQLTSPDIREGHFMAKTFEFNGFGCDGPNLSPALHWQNAPAGTQSYAITVFDPDAPTGSGFWHWLVLDIPASVTSLAQGAGNGQLPAGSRSFNNDYGIK